jgi:uncharacterized protein YijF (DUF1287 family)
LFFSRLTPVLGLVLVLATGSRAEMDPARLVSAAREEDVLKLWRMTGLYRLR